MKAMHKYSGKYNSMKKLFIMHQNTSCIKVILESLFASQATFAMLRRPDCILYYTASDMQSEEENHSFYLVFM